MGGMSGMGGTQFGGGSMGGGGITYGMASSQGGVFGAAPANQPSNVFRGTTFGDNSGSIAGAAGGLGAQPASSANMFAFGGASQFGGIGGGAGSFTAGAPVGGGGAAAGDDPYANIALDLTKVKAAPVAAKPFEAKTEEEKQKDAERRGSIKSNLKTTKADFDKAAESKKEVRFGKSTTYELNLNKDEEGAYNTAGMEKDGRGSPRINKNVVKETDLSDGRDE